MALIATDGGLSEPKSTTSESLTTVEMNRSRDQPDHLGGFNFADGEPAVDFASGRRSTAALAAVLVHWIDQWTNGFFSNGHGSIDMGNTWLEKKLTRTDAEVNNVSFLLRARSKRYLLRSANSCTLQAVSIIESN